MEEIKDINYDIVKIEDKFYNIEDIEILLFSYFNIYDISYLLCKINGNERKIEGINALKAYKRIKLAKYKGYNNLPLYEKNNFALINW